MKDYLIEKNEEKNKRGFVLDYILDDDNITIFYADGSNITKNIKGDEEHVINTINNIMTNQIVGLNKENKEYKLKKIFYTKCEKCITTVIAVCTALGLSGILSVLPTSFTAFLALVFSGVVGKQIVDAVKAKKLSDDYEKNSLFVQNENKLNEELQFHNMDNLNSNLSNKNLSFIDENKYELDIHNVNQIKLKQLKEMLDYFEKSKELEEVLNKSKVLKK